MLEKIREKLVRSKMKWAEEGRLTTLPADTATSPNAGTSPAAATIASSDDEAPLGADRLPPGQRLVTSWPVLDLGLQPEIPLDEVRLTIDGLVENPVTLDWAALQALPRHQMTVDIHCVTRWSRYDNQFGGVAISTLLDLVKPRPEARHILFEGHDGYTTNLKRSIFEAAQNMLAFSWAGEPLTREHGGPMRLIIPSVYFWKSTKWIRRISFSASDAPGFWEVRGYHNEGDPWRHERYSR